MSATYHPPRKRACGFRGALAWDKETGQPPKPSDLHIIIAASSAVGTTFTGTDIKNDPRYLGGLVGFAIVGNPSQLCPQTRYSAPLAQPRDELFAAGPAPW